MPQRDVVGRLARREFDLIGQEMAYRFRDVYDQFVRMADDAIVFQDRVTGVLDAHLASVSNRLADVSKVLAVIAALFGPLTVITGLFGMNVPLPTLFGSEAYQFWEIIGLMVLSSTALFFWFKQVRLVVDGTHQPASRRSRQSDCRRRSGRAAGVRRQGTDRERDRRQARPESRSPPSTAARN